MVPGKSIAHFFWIKILKWLFIFSHHPLDPFKVYIQLFVIKSKTTAHRILKPVTSDRTDIGRLMFDVMHQADKINSVSTVLLAMAFHVQRVDLGKPDKQDYFGLRVRKN